VEPESESRRRTPRSKVGPGRAPRPSNAKEMRAMNRTTSTNERETGGRWPVWTYRNFAPGAFTMNTDGTGAANLSNDPAGDFTPDWKSLR
jgi:hypothetical protein